MSEPPRPHQSPAGRGGAAGHVSANNYVVGVDFGTLSGRALVVRVSDGAELGSAVSEYRHGVMDEVLAATGAPLPPDWALQDPQDYLDVLTRGRAGRVKAAGIDPEQVIGIGTDFTACTVLPALSDGTPLCQLPGLEGRPHAYAKLWKHHAAQAQADRINALAHEHRPGLDRPLWRQDLLGVGVRQGAAAPGGRPRDL